LGRKFAVPPKLPEYRPPQSTLKGATLPALHWRLGKRNGYSFYQFTPATDSLDFKKLVSLFFPQTSFLYFFYNISLLFHRQLFK